MPSPEMVVGLADFFSIFGDSTRVRILLALDSGEMCVCDISETLGMSMSATSHQLRMLREAHLVSSRREGKNICYSLCDDHVRVVLETAVEHLSERIFCGFRSTPFHPIYRCRPVGRCYGFRSHQPGLWLGL